MRTAYEEVVHDPWGGVPAGAYTLFNTVPKVRRTITVTFDRREGARLALQLLWHSIRHRRWSFYVQHEDPKP